MTFDVDFALNNRTFNADFGKVIRVGGDTETAYNNGYADGEQAGQKAEWDRFWDAYQHNGERTRYAYAFAGVGWDKNNLLPPKYPISFNSGSYAAKGMFQQFKVDASAGDRYDFTEMSKLIDASQIVYANEMFADAQVENVTLDLSKCVVATSMFNVGNAGGDVDKLYLKVTEALKTTTSMFASCTNLKTFRFIEGSVLATSISFANSSKLSDASVDSIINAAKNGITITFHSNVVDRMTEEQWLMVDNKNITIA